MDKIEKWSHPLSENEQDKLMLEVLANSRSILSILEGMQSTLSDISRSFRTLAKGIKMVLEYTRPPNRKKVEPISAEHENLDVFFDENIVGGE